MADNAHHELAWQAPEFEHRPKTSTWYWVSIIVSILLLALAIWQRNFIFAVFVVIAELMLIIWGASEPRMIAFSLNQRGLTIGGAKFYPFSDIKSWSADSEGFFDPEWPDITLHLVHHFHTGLKVKVPRAMFLDVEKALRAHAREVPFEPSMIDVIEKLLGF
jgi:hypothetical protein